MRKYNLNIRFLRREMCLMDCKWPPTRLFKCGFCFVMIGSREGKTILNITNIECSAVILCWAGIYNTIYSIMYGQNI